MPVLPAPREFTVCEINRDLLTSKDDVDKTAQNAYVKIVGRVYPGIPFRVNQPENGRRTGNGSNSYYDEDQLRDGSEGCSPCYSSPVPSSSEREGDLAEEDGPRGFLTKQLSTAKSYLTSIYHAVVAPPEMQGVETWKYLPQLQQRLGDEFFLELKMSEGYLGSKNWVETLDKSLGDNSQFGWASNDATFVPLGQAVNWHKHKHWLAFISTADQVLVYDFGDPESRDPAVLTCDSQRFVEAVEWRPNSGGTLAVACRGGICIWSASFPGNMAPVRPGVGSHLGTPMRGTGARWSPVDYLKSNDKNAVTCISWNPNGRLLATASRYGSAITIWDAALGIGTPVRRGFAGISMLGWSPTGDYLFSAKINGAFDLWETNLWTSEPWSAAGGNLVSAMWGPDGHVLLLAFDKTTTLGTIYFPSRPPSLDVHLLPLDLPEICAITEGKGSIERMAWDGTGERLAVSYTGANEIYTGLIAIFDTRHVPIVSTTFLGFIRGPGYGVKPLAFAFHNRLKQGALLAGQPEGKISLATNLSTESILGLMLAAHIEVECWAQTRSDAPPSVLALIQASRSSIAV